MIKKVKFFINNNPKSIKYAKIVKEDFIKNGFVFDDNEFDLGVAIGGDGAFLRMVKQSNFDSNPYYIGINTGHLGFLQEVKVNEHNKLIEEIKEEKYQIENIGIQETDVKTKDLEKNYYSLNEIVVRDKNLDLLRSNVYINNDLLEQFNGDGLMLATSIGSTAYNLSYGGSIVYPTFSTLQITSMAPINSKRYRSMINSVIIPSEMKVKLVPINNSVMVTVDGENNIFDDIKSITSSIDDKKIKCLRLNNYNYPQKINEKLLS